MQSAGILRGELAPSRASEGVGAEAAQVRIEVVRHRPEDARLDPGRLARSRRRIAA